MAIESAKYSVLQKHKDIELREYASYITATVKVEGSSHNEAGRNAFSVLAGYIFGNNVQSEKMSMTAPVSIKERGHSIKIAMTAPVTIQRNNNYYEVSFTMPSEFTMKTIPVPVDKRIAINKVQKRKAAAITFKGATPERKLVEKTQRLRNWIEHQSLSEEDTPIVAKYDSPAKPLPLRKNEVIIFVGQSGDSS